MTSGAAPTPRRLDGVDVARAVAILGMVTVHVGPLPITEDGLAAFLYGSWHGKASVLFVLVAGIGVTLLGRRGTAREVRARLVWRAVWLFPLGLWLQALDHPVAVILQYYALYFLLVAPFVTRRDRTLLGWAAALVAVGGTAVLVTTVVVPQWVVPLRGDSPTGVLGDVVLFGYYPAVTWLVPMLWGVWLGRRRLDRPGLQVRLVVGGSLVLAATVALSRFLASATGTAVDVGGWGHVLSVAAHSDMPLAVLGATGFATAVLGAALWATARVPRLLAPLAASGRLALTVYVGHLLVFHLVPSLLPADDVWEGIRTVTTFGVVTSALALAWLAVLPRGPLEAVTRWPYQAVIRPLLSPPAPFRSSSPASAAGTADPAPPTAPARSR